MTPTADYRLANRLVLDCRTHFTLTVFQRRYEREEPDGTIVSAWVDQTVVSEVV